MIFFLQPSPVHRLSGKDAEHSNATAIGTGSTGINGAVIMVQMQAGYSESDSHVEFSRRFVEIMPRKMKLSPS